MMQEEITSAAFQGIADKPIKIPSPSHDKAVGAGPRPWVRSQSRGGVAKPVGAWPRPWGLNQSRGGVANAVRSWTRLWGHGQGCGGVVMAVGAWPRK